MHGLGVDHDKTIHIAKSRSVNSNTNIIASSVTDTLSATVTTAVITAPTLRKNGKHKNNINNGSRMKRTRVSSNRKSSIKLEAGLVSSLPTSGAAGNQVSRKASISGEMVKKKKTTRCIFYCAPLNIPNYIYI